MAQKTTNLGSFGAPASKAKKKGRVYVYAAQGMTRCAGTASHSRFKFANTSGASWIGGTAVSLKERAPIVGGSIEISGVAPIQKEFAPGASGSATISGAALAAKVEAFVGSGDFFLVGSPAYRFTPGAVSNIFAYIASGGFVCSGSAESRFDVVTGAGGITKRRHIHFSDLSDYRPRRPTPQPVEISPTFEGVSIPPAPIDERSIPENQGAEFPDFLTLARIEDALLLGLPEDLDAELMAHPELVSLVEDIALIFKDRSLR
jgi:hypothetical protein